MILTLIDQFAKSFSSVTRKPSKVIKIASWNINSVRLRAETVARFLKEFSPDVLTLQETKCPEGQFPTGVFSDIGYNHIAERGQSGYHGVAVISKVPFKDQSSRQFCGKEDARHISVKLDIKNPLTIHSFYVPAGGDVPDQKLNEKFDHKISFLNEMENWLTADFINQAGPCVLTGDLNIAPDENDVWSHKQLLKVVSHTPQETDKLARVLAAGNWQDTLRHHAKNNEKLYSWWSYRARDWEKSNRGRRLDHIWLDKSLAPKCSKTQIITQTRGWDRPSDHVPIIVTINL